MRHTLGLSTGLGAALWLCAMPGLASTYAVGPAGQSGCTHSSIQAALITAASHVGADEVHVSSGSWTNQQLIVADSSALAIRGGYASCTSSFASSRSVLQGTGAQSVIRTAPGMQVDVTLSGFEIRDGRGQPGADYGGGLNHMAAGKVTISNSQIRHNVAAYGGGIAMRKPDGALEGARELILGAGVVIGDALDAVQGNSAILGGGGIYLADGALSIAGEGSTIAGNHSDGNGGGVYVEGRAAGNVRADFGSGGDGSIGAGILVGNSALETGGAVYATGLHALIRIAASEPVLEAAVVGNTAVYGGAFDLHDGADLHAWNAVVVGNSASGSGGALVLRDGANAWFGADTALGGAPGFAIGCGARAVCGNRIVGNLGGNELGAVFILISNVATGSSSLALESTVLRGNAGMSLIGDFCSPGISCTHNVLLRNSLIWSNAFDHVLQTWGETAATAWVDNCTIAGNAGNGALFEGNYFLQLRRSIVWQSGRTLLHLTDGALTQADHLLVHSTEGLPLSTDVQVADPLFENPAGGNLRLQPGSPALDRAPAAGTTVFDLAGALRVVDLPSLANGDGTLDLGAYELQAIPDLIFANGFN